MLIRLTASFLRAPRASNAVPHSNTAPPNCRDRQMLASSGGGSVLRFGRCLVLAIASSSPALIVQADEPPLEPIPLPAPIAEKDAGQNQKVAPRKVKAKPAATPVAPPGAGVPTPASEEDVVLGEPVESVPSPDGLFQFPVEVEEKNEVAADVPLEAIPLEPSQPVPNQVVPSPSTANPTTSAPVQPRRENGPHGSAQEIIVVPSPSTGHRLPQTARIIIYESHPVTPGAAVGAVVVKPRRSGYPSAVAVMQTLPPSFGPTAFPPPFPAMLAPPFPPQMLAPPFPPSFPRPFRAAVRRSVWP